MLLTKLHLLEHAHNLFYCTLMMPSYIAVDFSRAIYACNAGPCKIHTAILEFAYNSCEGFQECSTNIAGGLHCCLCFIWLLLELNINCMLFHIQGNTGSPGDQGPRGSNGDAVSLLQ